jgi:hypothetical protein
MEPSTYPSCSGSNRANCTYDGSKINAFRFTKVPGCSGQAPASCGIRLVDENFNSATLTFTGKLTYTGKDTAIKDTVITVVLPPEQLQPKQISCPSGTPFFAGFTADGTIKCVGLPTECGPGFYASGFNISTLAPICKGLPSYVNCEYIAPGQGQVLTSYEWKGGLEGASFTCASRTRAMAESMFGFSPLYTPATRLLPPVNCQGGWSSCSGTCGTGQQIYQITTNAANGGSSCPYANGTTRACGLPACPVNCQGNWGQCIGTCDSGIQTYQISTYPVNGGNACEAANGSTRVCSLPACPVNTLKRLSCTYSGYHGTVPPLDSFYTPDIQFDTATNSFIFNNTLAWWYNPPFSIYNYPLGTFTAPYVNSTQSQYYYPNTSPNMSSRYVIGSYYFEYFYQGTTYNAAINQNSGFIYSVKTIGANTYRVTQELANMPCDTINHVWGIPVDRSCRFYANWEQWDCTREP